MVPHMLQILWPGFFFFEKLIFVTFFSIISILKFDTHCGCWTMIWTNINLHHLRLFFPSCIFIGLLDSKKKIFLDIVYSYVKGWPPIIVAPIPADNHLFKIKSTLNLHRGWLQTTFSLFEQNFFDQKDFWKILVYI